MRRKPSEELFEHVEMQSLTLHLAIKKSHRPECPFFHTGIVNHFDNRVVCKFYCYPTWSTNEGVRRKIVTAKEARIAILDCLGHRCVRCGFEDDRALQIDHRRSNGAEDRRHGRKNHYHLILAHIQESPDQDEYQILCANCNWIKRHEMEECGSDTCLSGTERMRWQTASRFSNV